MYPNYAACVLAKGLNGGAFDSKFEQYVERNIKWDEDSFYCRAESSTLAEKYLQDWDARWRTSAIARQVKMVAKGMRILASNRPELTTGTIINSQIPQAYGFPLADMRGYSDLAVILLPMPALTSGAHHMGQLRAVTANIGKDQLGNMAQISFVFEPYEMQQAFDVFSFDVYGNVTGERRRAFGSERELLSDVHSCVRSALGIGSAPGSFSCGGTLTDLGWTRDKLSDIATMIAEYLCVLAIR